MGRPPGRNGPCRPSGSNERLGLWGSSVNDSRLADLEGLSRLRTLGLHKTRIGDKGLANLKEFAGPSIAVAQPVAR